MKQLSSPDLATKGEPHLSRRYAILKEFPQIKTLYGYDPNTAVKTVWVMAAQLGVAFVLSRAHEADKWWGSFWVLLVLSYAIGAFASKWAGVAIHEASHNVVFRTTVQNKLLRKSAEKPSTESAADFHSWLLPKRNDVSAAAFRAASFVRLPHDVPVACPVRNACSRQKISTSHRLGS